MKVWMCLCGKGNHFTFDRTLERMVCANCGMKYDSKIVEVWDRSNPDEDAAYLRKRRIFRKRFFAEVHQVHGPRWKRLSFWVDTFFWLTVFTCLTWLSEVTADILWPPP
jgi:hypothetical protein